MRKLGSSILIILSALTVSQGHAERAYGEPLLASARSFEVSNTPFAVATGDLNRDGKADVVAANSVLLGNGDGTFQTRVDYTAVNPYSVVIGDLNHDAKSDLATVNGTVVSVFLGNGDGTFQTRADYATSGVSSSIAIGDLNGDRNLDLVTADGAAVSVFLGVGDGTFNTRADYAVGGSRRVAIADVNRDTRPDLVTTDAATVSVLLGSGDGSFRAPAQYPARSGRIAANQTRSLRRSRNSTDAYWGNDLALAVGDLNGDGTPDLAIANPEIGKNNSIVSILLGRGDGTFQTHVDYRVLDYPSGIAIGDVSGDATPDVVTANDWSGTVSILRGAGDGTFPTRVDYGTGGAGFAVVIGEVNGDGRPDIITSNYSPNTVSVLLGAEHNEFMARRDYPVGRIPFHAAIGDVDGDGKLDVASGNWDENTVTLYFGRGDGTLDGRVDVGASAPRYVAIGDMNGDGRGDLAVASDYSTVTILLNLGGRTFSPPIELSLAASSIVIRDVNGDMKPDLIASGEGAAVLLGNGDGTFHATMGYWSRPVSSHSVAVGDLNRDGKLDLATANSDGTASVFMGNGDGTFQTNVDYAAGPNPGSVGIGDLNGDGNPDLMTGNSSLGGLSVLLGNGDGTFRPKSDYGTGRSLYRAAIADLNGDGKPDIVAAVNTATGGAVAGTVAVFAGVGDGTFDAPLDYDGAARGIASVSIGDMNGDGSPDVVAANQGCETVSILRNISGRESILNARVRFDPNVINLGNHAKWVTAFIEPIGFNPSNIDISSLRLAGSTPPAPRFSKVADHDRNGRPDLMVRFSRQALDPLLTPGTNQLEVTGSLMTGERFSGRGTVRVTNQANSQQTASVSPNPVNPGGDLSFYVGRAGPVRIRLFDRGGRLVKTMLDVSAMEAGSHHLAIDGRSARGMQMASGIYFYKIETPEGAVTGRFAVLK